MDRCNASIIIIDTGISSAYGGVLSALEVIYTLTPVGHREDPLLPAKAGEAGAGEVAAESGDNDSDNDSGSGEIETGDGETKTNGDADASTSTSKRNLDLAQHVLVPGVAIRAGEKYIEREEVYAVYPTGRKQIALQVRELVM